ncbi:MAG: hypothetical protein Kow0089_21340 [Desulfobulbaceae bacterium]
MIRVGAKLVLIFALVYAGVTIWYGRLEERLRVPAKPRAETAAAPEKKTEILRKPDDYTIIVERNIFQAMVTRTEASETRAEPVELAPTKLKLSLMGTISGAERDARAIISDDAKRQQDIYQVGDSIQGALIKSIERGKVVLVVNGRDEVLTLKERKGGGPAYQPDPSDFYQEQQDAPQPQVQARRQQPGQPQATRRPAVRPRPVRRPSTPAGPAVEQQGSD